MGGQCHREVPTWPPAEAFITGIKMGGQYHREVFTWPPAEAFIAGSNFTAHDIGIHLIENDVKNELINMVQKAKDQSEDEPFCVFDVGTIVKRYELWSKAFPLIRPFFALKVYDDPVVVKLLARLGAGFDCASKGEIELVQKVGVAADDIVFANPMKIPSHISYAAEKEVSLMTFDSHEELLKVKEKYPKAKLLLRIRPIGNDDVQVAFSKFGCDLNDVLDLLRAAKGMNICLVGVAFHIGSGCTNSENYVKQIEVARRIFDMAENEGITMSILDIGGGFFGSKDAEQILLQICDAINDCITRLFPGVMVISEPGRFFVESALTLATSIIGRRTRKTATHEASEYVISASAFSILNHSIAMSCFSSFKYQPSLILREPCTPSTQTYMLSGPTVAPHDMIDCEQIPELQRESNTPSTQTYTMLSGPSVCPHDRINCKQLPELQIGDWLLFEEVGAYTITASTAFNSFPKPPIYRVMNNDVWAHLMNDGLLG